MNKESLASAIQDRENTIRLMPGAVENDILEVLKIFKRVIRQGGRILTFGNGGSAAQAEHLATELMVRFSRNRNPISSICLSTSGVHLTAHANDFSFESVFSRQIEALASSSDVCVAFSTSGTSPNIVAAEKAAQDLGVPFLLFTGSSESIDVVFSKSLVVKVPSQVTAIIQEMHLVLLHIICEEIDEILES